MTSTHDGIVEFRFFRGRASSVYLAGDFNGWRTDELRMRSLGDGWWGIEMELPQGEYRFRYLADAAWHTDYAANGVELKKGNWNSILMVNAPATRAAQRITQPEEHRIAA